MHKIFNDLFLNYNTLINKVIQLISVKFCTWLGNIKISLLWCDEETTGEGVELTDPKPEAEWWGDPEDRELLGRDDKFGTLSAMTCWEGNLELRAAMVNIVATFWGNIT